MKTRNIEVETWFRLKSKHVQKWASKYSKEDGEDILQEITLNLLTNPGDWVNISRKKIERWTMYDYYNKSRGFKGESDKTLVSLESAMETSSVVNMEADLYAKKCVELVTELVDCVNGAGKQIFLMHFFQDMGYDEISEKLGIPHGSCRQLGMRAKNIIVNEFKRIVK